MSLRAQLLAVALLTLVLPWAGWRYVTEMEAALRAGLEQSLSASAATMASAFADPALVAPLPRATLRTEAVVYAHPLAFAPRIDGYGGDWSIGEQHARPLGSEHRYRAGIYERHLYLLLEVTDENIVYQSAPTETPYGDRLLLNLGGMPERWLLLHTAAPGELRARYTSPAEEFAPTERYEDRVLASWVETSRGYAVETRVPLELLGPQPVIGLAVIDVRPASGGAFEARMEASWEVGREPPGALVFRPQQLAEAASRFTQPGRRVRIVDAAGWVLYDAGALDPAFGARVRTPGFGAALIRFILDREDPEYSTLEQPPGHLADAALRGALDGAPVARWYRRAGDASAVVAAAVPIRDVRGISGAVLLEQGSDAILTLTNDALVRLMSFTVLASLMAGGVLLGYATLLSLRVRGLARAAETALSPRGDIEVALPGQRARDEIGGLARSFADLLHRLREYTEYLRTLKGKLAHELRTPLAVLSTSLDNLEREPHDAQLTPYIKRLREGSDRLDAIINAMSEATAIEQAVTDVPTQVFELGSVVTSCVAAYQDVHRERRFRLTQDIDRAWVRGSPELMAQLLDKLVDNAVDFSAAGATIDVHLEPRGEAVVLSVSNPGPPLPAKMRAQLFDSLVSVRQRTQERRHLGLGLYIAALIARFHGGRIEGDDLPDGSGAIFRVTLPLTQRP